MEIADKARKSSTFERRAQQVFRPILRSHLCINYY